MSARSRYLVAALILTLSLDQLTKRWALASIHPGEVHPLIPGLLDLTIFRNPGGIFSWLADADIVVRMSILVGGTVAAFALMAVFYRRMAPDSRLSACALGAAFGGAIGNTIDRLEAGSVIDFLSLTVLGNVLPLFNLADAWVFVGVAILLGGTLSSPPELQHQPRTRLERSEALVHAE